MRRDILTKLAATILLVLLTSRGQASETAAPEWSVHGQTTVVEQWHGSFYAPYAGTNSLGSGREDKHTGTLTLFLGRALWRGGELYYNPEITQGAGLSGTLGVAGFPNGEATRVGSSTPEYNTARLSVRQAFSLGGGTESLESDKNQIVGSPDSERLVLTFGKLAASDIFDTNRYSHDPRTQFLNWALMENGAWDYPADTKGYTGGFTAEWKRPADTIRWGVFLEPQAANGRALDKHLARAWGQVFEWEIRYRLGGREGALRPLVYWNRAHMGSYAVALGTAAGNPPDITLSRSYRSKAGTGINWEQEIADGLGVFARAGCNDGQAETWAFTEIDRTISTGLSVKGSRWGRSDDTFGIAGVANGLSAEHRRYLAAGGYGFIVGDGALRYGVERIVESYYDWKAVKWLSLAADIQFVAHPAYNRDRGPATIIALRAHAEF